MPRGRLVRQRGEDYKTYRQALRLCATTAVEEYRYARVTLDRVRSLLQSP